MENQKPQEEAPQIQIFDEDVISFEVTDKNEHKVKRIALVSALGWDPENPEESQSEDDDEEDKDSKLAEDEIEVTWFDNQDEVCEKISRNDVGIIDRALLPGDVVGLVSAPTSQSGTVIGVKQFLDLRFPDGKTVQGVPSDLVYPIHSFQEDTYVVYKAWLGKVTGQVLDVTVKLEDKSVCLIYGADYEDVLPEEVYQESGWETEDFFNEYFPSMTVRCKGKVLKKAFYKEGSYKGQPQAVGVVLDVYPNKVEIEWLTTMSSETEPPPRKLRPEELYVVDHFAYVRWQMGDRPICPENKLQEWQKQQKEEHTQINNTNQTAPSVSSNSNNDINNNGHSASNSSDKKKKKGKSKQYHDFSTSCALITCTHTYVDVCFQDSTVQRSMDSVQLFPVHNVLDEDFWPEDFIVDRNNENKVGVIEAVHHEERTCDVRWLPHLDLTQQQSSNQPETEEKDVPVFSLKNHPDWTYRIADIVLLLSDQFKEGEIKDLNQHDEDETDHKGASVIGEVKDIQKGKLLVHWVDQTETFVEPNQLFRYSTDEDDQDQFEVENNDEEDEDSEETESQIAATGGPAPAFIQQSNTAWWHEPEMSQDNIDLFKQVIDTTSSQQIPSAVGVVSPVQPGTSNSNDNGTQQDGAPSEFPNFDVVEEVVDHHFISKEMPHNLSKLMTCMMHEWDLIKNALHSPDRSNVIYVKTFESRADLLQFAITGPKDTPYEDIMFIFDMYVPPTYPAIPPEIHYRSFGDKLNPNLYKDGRVCLSLLGTWSGKGNENWNPAISNLLQVILSIQGLILGVHDPYFLEAGYDKLKGAQTAEKASKLYNESAFLLSRETIPNILHNSPIHFRELVRHHYKTKGEAILNACRAQLDPNNNNSGNVFIENPSPGFLKALQQILYKLEECLKNIQ